MRLPRRQRLVIDLALSILRSANGRAGKVRVDTIEVRLALYCLLPHCPERWPLTNFWDSGQQPNDLARGQGVAAAFNGICRQLRMAQRYPGSNDA